MKVIVILLLLIFSFGCSAHQAYHLYYERAEDDGCLGPTDEAKASDYLKTTMPPDCPLAPKEWKPPAMPTSWIYSGLVIIFCCLGMIALATWHTIEYRKRIRRNSLLNNHRADY